MNISQAYPKDHAIKRILLIEDDVDISLIAAHHLKQNQCLVDQAYSCAQAMEFLKAHSYDLILLDELLPDKNGSDFCAIIRPQCSSPIIFMSCCSDSASIITALKNGGDDYMVKPVDYRELMARAEAICRRLYNEEAAPDTLRRFYSFAIDTIQRNIVRNGQTVDLTPIEYNLLVYMADHPDILLSYRELYEQIWNCDSLGDNRTIMVHISNLRKKLDPDNIGIISTVRGVGYIFSDR